MNQASTTNNSYLGNTNLKSANVQINWTPEMIQEWVKCKNDPVYFAENYIKIVHVDKGLITIDLYDYQREIIKKITDHRRLAVVTSRQAGKTTTAAVVILHYVLFNDYKRVGLLANKGDSAREILDRIKIAFEALPKWIQQGVVEWNKGSVELENGSKIIASSTSSSAIRGKSMNLLYIDETAFVEGWDEFSASVLPTISSGETTKVLYTSTPNGLNHFYKICVGAKEGTNGYQYVEVPWYKVPGRDEKWKKEALETLNYDYQKFSQEYEVEFQGSSGTLIDGSKLKQLVPREPLIEKNGLALYEKYQKDNQYVCIVDVSRGKGLDYSAFSIIDVTKMPYKQVCTFKDNLVTPTEYAEIIFRTCKTFGECVVLVEINDIGQQVSETLHYDYEYENVLYTESAGRSGKRISGGFGKGADPGVRTTKQVKSIGCNMLKLMIEQDQLIINDMGTINELSTFSRKGVSYEAEPGCNDDLVMCLVLFGWLSDQQYFKDITNINTLARLRERSEDELLDELTPFGFYDNGIKDTADEDSFVQGGDRWVVDKNTGILY
jgi:hypothetical protein